MQCESGRLVTWELLHRRVSNLVKGRHSKNLQFVGGSQPPSSTLLCTVVFTTFLSKNVYLDSPEIKHLNS